MVKNAQREKLVRKLGGLAEKCGLDAVDSQVSRKVVRNLVASIQSGAGPANAKKEAEKALAAYEKTFANKAGASEPFALPVIKCRGRLLKFPSAVMKDSRMWTASGDSHLASGGPVQCCCAEGSAPSPRTIYYYICQTGCESLFRTMLVVVSDRDSTKLVPAL